MSNLLIRKLEVADGLTDGDRTVLERLCARSQEIGADRDLTHEGDRPENVHLVLEGFAARYKMLPDGKRQIMAVLLPGDFCDLHVAILGAMDHSIMTLTPCSIVTIPRTTIVELTENHPRINRALWWATLVDEGVLREWLVNLGQRQAAERMAHFFCEMLVRLQTVGLATENSYALPLTQIELGDVFGISTVHVNRALQELRGADLVVLEKRRVTIPDVERLKASCGFRPNYLHLTPRPNGRDA